MVSIGSFHYRVLSLLIVASALSFTASGTQKVRIPPAPKGIELSSDFAVAIEGTEVPVYKTKVPPGDSIPRLSGSRREFGYHQGSCQHAVDRI